jgi:methylthioribulose-1-phosphate dehydratase
LDPHCYGILLAGHGIYVWGKSIEEAKRHLEVFEYVFKYYLGKR